MRGGPPRASMKLDNRPKKLLVKDVAPDTVQAIRDWYETTGQIESVDALDSGDIVITFRSRGAAEQVCRYIRVVISCVLTSSGMSGSRKRVEHPHCRSEADFMVHGPIGSNKCDACTEGSLSQWRVV